MVRSRLNSCLVSPDPPEAKKIRKREMGRCGKSPPLIAPHLLPAAKESTLDLCVIVSLGGQDG